MPASSALRALLLLCLAAHLGCGARTGLSDLDAGHCNTDEECSDGRYCTGTETCSEGLCLPGVPVDCNDDEECTVDRCVEPGEAGAGRCENEDVRVDADGDTHFALHRDLVACGDDCDDEDPNVYPGAPEVCNGRDDDCDTMIDEGASYSPEDSDIRLTRDVAQSARGAVAFSPESNTWGATYWDYGGGSADIYFLELDPTGTPVALPKLLTREPGDAFGASIVWTGREYAIAWEDRRDGDFEVYFNRLSPDGEKLAPDYRITYAPDFSIRETLVFTGEEYAIAWQDGRHRVGEPDNFELYLAFLDVNGFEIGDDIRLTRHSASSEAPNMALGDGELGIVFVDTRRGAPQVFFLVTDLRGTVVLSPVQLSRAVRARNPVVVWTGTAFVATWQEESAAGNDDVAGARIPRSPDGPVAGPTLLVGGRNWTRTPSLLANGGGLLLLFADDRAGSYDLYAATFDEHLRRLAGDARVTHGAMDSIAGYPARGPDSIGILFNDQRDRNWEVYFTRLLCIDP